MRRITLGECIEKRFLFFEHKGTRIFETRKPLFKKKPHIPCFLNYQPIFEEQNRRFPTQVTLNVACRFQLAHPLSPCGLWPAIAYLSYSAQHVASLLFWQDGMPCHARQDTGGSFRHPNSVFYMYNIMFARARHIYMQCIAYSQQAVETLRATSPNTINK